ncbi:Uncharacterised protein [uncultured archaeon]|nr:Uncharacterised protein [uncultured archaeon]
MKYIVDPYRTKIIRAKDSAFIPTVNDGDFPLRPSQSYKLKTLKHKKFCVHL